MRSRSVPTRRPVRWPGGLLFGVLLGSVTTPIAGQDVPDFARGDRWATDFSRITVAPEEIVSGGPPKDGIASIDQPKFEDVETADDWIHEREPVAVVRNGGVTKIYPLMILIQHEIVNDVLGGRAVSVTYCPLCNTTIVFDRWFDEQFLDFGTTGRLRHSDLVMYDRQTETWWQQATGEGIVGRYAGERLTMMPSSVLSWRDAREGYPDAMVLSRDTGFRRQYGGNPYVMYDRLDGGPIRRFFRFGRDDDRLRAMDRVVALEWRGEYMAVPYPALEAEGVANVEVGGRPVVVFWKEGTSSPVDRQRTGGGDDVGSSATFYPVVDGRTLTFERTDSGEFRDRETGSTWTITGVAASGPFEGTRLDELVHGTHFWFAWATFRPETTVWRP